MAKLDAEEATVAWLNSILPTGWAAYGDKPKQLPEKYVLVDRTGGPREAMVLDRAEILIEVYHKTSRVEAKNQANTIADRIRELESVSDNLTHAAVNSVVNLDDVIAQYHRYQVYCDVFCRR
jgi:hypothetical protein